MATITVEPTELEAARQVALRKLAKTTRIDGFRKGRAPLEVVAKHADQAALAEETLNNALSKAVAEAFVESDLQVLERPEVEVKKYVPGSELEFTAEAQVMPEIALGDYKKLKLTQTKVSVSKEEVDEVLDRIAGNMAEKTETAEAAHDGDEVTIDFVGKRDGAAFPGGTGKDYPLVLGSKSFIPGFEEALVGLKKGDTKDIDLIFPADYHAKDLAGQAVVFETTVKGVKHVIKPTYNDEFAAKVGPFTSMNELTQDIEKEITAQKQREADDVLRDEAVKQLVDKSTVPVPEVLRHDQLQSIERDMIQNLMGRGLSLEDYMKQKGFKDKDEWLEKEARPDADRRIKAGLALAELSKAENITASQDELAERINVFKQQYANSPEMAKRFDEPEIQHEIANRLLTEKTIDRLVALNTPAAKKSSK